MHLYEFGNSVIMTAIHGPNAAGKPFYGGRIFTSEEGDWKIVLSSQTDINHPNGASDQNGAKMYRPHHPEKRLLRSSVGESE